MIEVEGLTKRYGDNIAVDELTDASRSTTVRVRTPDAGRLRQLLVGDDAAVSSQTPDVLEVRGFTSEDIGPRAAAAGVVLFELVPQQVSLEETFMELTRDAVQYHARPSSERIAA